MDERRTLHYKWGKNHEKVKVASFWFLYFRFEKNENHFFLGGGGCTINNPLDSSGIKRRVKEKIKSAL